MKPYLDVIRENTLGLLLTLPHKHKGAHPTGFIVQTDDPIDPFPFTLCPLSFIKPSDPLVGTNPHDVILRYTKEQGDLERLLYELWELYAERHLESTAHSQKRYCVTKSVPPRKIIIPCFGRKENLTATVKRLQMISVPQEGYHPLLCIVEHSPYPELEGIAAEFNAEYLWIFLDPREISLPVGQFNKALCYDKAFLFTSPAEWYLFHDNDVLVPRNFWERLDANIKRTKSRFLQPYTHRSPLYTKPEVAEQLRENLELADQRLLDEMIDPICPGAPGGSLYLHRDRYLEVGGHDPNYCWGYGPEDMLFFQKLELCEPIAYADDPPIEMIHLWHPTASVQNPYRWDMDWFVKLYFKQKSSDEKRMFMTGKKELLETILRSIETSHYSRTTV